MLMGVCINSTKFGLTPFFGFIAMEQSADAPT